MAVVDPLLGGVDAPDPRDRAPPPVLPLPAAAGLHRAHPRHRRRAAGAGPERASAGSSSTGSRTRPGALRSALLAELEQSASQQVIQGLGHDPAGPAARAAAGARGHAARPRRGPDRHRAGRPGPAHPPHLRALVHQGGPAVAPGRDGADPAAVRAPAAARSRATRSRTSRSSWATARPRRCRCTCGPSSGSPRASSGCRSRPTRRWPRSPAATSPRSAGRPHRETDAS